MNLGSGLRHVNKALYFLHIVSNDKRWGCISEEKVNPVGTTAPQRWADLADEQVERHGLDVGSIAPVHGYS
jgi:hypothetical protein